MIKLHLGCGKRDFGADWVHIDGSHFPHVKYHNVRDLDFEDNSVDLIYASHLFEYFDIEEGREVLKEWNRVLKVGGVLRLAVPDFEAMVKLYLDSDIPLKKFIGPLYGKMTANDGDEDFNIYHRMTYDLDTLSDLLSSCGFGSVKRYDWRKTEHAEFDDHSQAYIPHMDKDSGTLISLNIEAQKMGDIL